MLWGRAAARCAMPDCRRHLVEDATETDDEALVGENCHIVGDSQNGPRGNDPMDMARRDKYGNLILLCRIHHRIIDQQVNTYSVDALHKIKDEHETWVKESLGEFDPAKQRDDEQYAAIIDGWARLSHLSEWEAWTSWVLGSGQPRLWDSINSDLEELRKWLLNRFWPGRYPDLEKFFQNFRLVLSDFQRVFHEHSELKNDTWFTEKFYKRIWHDDIDDYNRLSIEYDNHVDLVSDLCFELTRSANIILELVRKLLTSSYRENEGFLVVQRGPNMYLGYSSYVTKYSDENMKIDPVYPGLNNFLKVLPSRDFYFSTPPAI
jgi:hypothetical protein